MTLFFLGVSNLAYGLTIHLPPETAQNRKGLNSELANAQCLSCHSADYVLTQPPDLSRNYWNAIVLKMKSKFGAPISEAQVAPLVDYLVKTYGAENVRAKAQLSK